MYLCLLGLSLISSLANEMAIYIRCPFRGDDGWSRVALVAILSPVGDIYGRYLHAAKKNFYNDGGLLVKMVINTLFITAFSTRINDMFFGRAEG